MWFLFFGWRGGPLIIIDFTKNLPIKMAAESSTSANDVNKSIPNIRNNFWAEKKDLHFINKLP